MHQPSVHLRESLLIPKKQQYHDNLDYSSKTNEINYKTWRNMFTKYLSVLSYQHLKWNTFQTKVTNIPSSLEGIRGTLKINSSLLRKIL